MNNGINNIGNTCYMNSILQCLINTVKLKTYFLSDEYNEDKNMNNIESKLSDEYRTINNDINYGIITPVNFKKILGNLNYIYKTSNQQDAHEFLINIIELLSKGCSYKIKIKVKGEIKNEKDKLELKCINKFKKLYQNNYSIFTKLFYGQYNNILKCINCNYTNNNFDPFCNIMLETKYDSVIECLDDYMKEEKLDDENMWNCDNCNKKCNAIKKINIWKLPEILTLTLKRFEYSNKSKKIDKLIKISDKIDMSKYLTGYNDKSVYQIYAICNHTGNVNGGHYFSYCKTENKWYNYNDSSVSEIDKVVSNNAYILFYRKL